MPSETPGVLTTSRDTTVLTVSELNARVRLALDRFLGSVWVAGEVSGLRIAASGHTYFRLKDATSQIAAVMFRSAARRAGFVLRDGLEILVRGRVDVYEVRGDLQLYVDEVEPLGLGRWRLALEQLREKLAAEGLFDPERKRPLPFWPRKVGVATALKGAAVHDIVTTLRRRLPGVAIVLRPVPVQGRGAAAEIVRALAELADCPGVDVIIVGRGGGSVEDLWEFNEETLVRAIAASPVPIVSAVGHEIDVTLADLAADQRAATPTAAASLVVPDARELTRELGGLLARMQSLLRRRVERERERFRLVAERLRDPRERVRDQRLRIDDLAERGRRALETFLRFQRYRLTSTSERLNGLSPLAILERGFSLVQRETDGAVVRSAEELNPGTRLRITLARGWVRATVEEKGSNGAGTAQDV